MDETERQAYERWVDEWSGDLYRFAHRLCGRADTAEDLVQETFYHAWRSMHSLRDGGRARAWLFQILRHRWSHYVRSETRRPKLNAPLESVGERPDGRRFEPLGDMARAEALQNALDGLEERYRLPLLMVFMEGITCREAAERLNVPLGTVLSRIHRGRRSLRRALGSDAEEFGLSFSDEKENETGSRLRLRGDAS